MSIFFNNVPSMDSVANGTNVVDCNSLSLVQFFEVFPLKRGIGMKVLRALDECEFSCHGGDFDTRLWKQGWELGKVFDGGLPERWIVRGQREEESVCFDRMLT